jgi:hypothetical protein
MNVAAKIENLLRLVRKYATRREKSKIPNKKLSKPSNITFITR